MSKQNYETNREILTRLVMAQSEDQVTDILDDPFFKHVEWKPYGGTTSNFSTITTQQSDAVNALCEKPVNSIDHIFLKECGKAGIDPEGQDAPKSMREAAEKFFGIPGGDLNQISEERRRELAKNIMIIADGTASTPNIMIADRGEGQHPTDFEKTLLSLQRHNKVKILFVQGKYNMGSTGVLPFCGSRGYQLILSRKSIELSDKNSEWGFTLVREKPDVDESYKTTWYEYFTDTEGEIFRLLGTPLKILPGNQEFLDGCFIKLYSYQLQHPSIATKDLWEELNRKLFGPALPILMVENRINEFKITPDKNDTKVLIGNRFRTMKNRKDIYKIINIKSTLQGFGNNTIEVTIFNHANKTGGENVSNRFTNFSEAVFLTQNGQTHLAIGRSTFKTKTNFSHLADYVMVHVDLTHINRTKSKIFMASRDRNRNSNDYRELEKRLFEDIKEDDNIKAVHEEYMKLDMSNIANDPTIDDAISSIIKKNPHLANLLDLGTSSELEKRGQVDRPPFVGQYFPTFLKVKGYYGPGDYIQRIPNNGEPAYLTLVTDASNDYLTRDIDRGVLQITWPGEVQGTHHELFNGRIPIKLLASKKSIPGDIPGVLTATLSRPDNTSLICNVILEYYIPVTTGIKKKSPKKTRISGFLFPKFDPVLSDRWKEFGWDENSIAKVDPEVIHVNLDCKALTDYRKARPSPDEKKITKMFGISMYFHVLMLNSDLKEDQSYDQIFKKSMCSIAKAELPIIYDTKDIAVEKLIGINVTK